MTDDESAIIPELVTYLINLDRSADRLDLMTRRMAAATLGFERVAAIDGGRLPFPNADFDQPSYTVLHGRTRNPAEVGCYLSHIECARRFLSTDAAYALVLEDDVTLPADLKQILAGASQSSASWDILRLSTVNSGKKYAFKRISPQRSLAIALTREKGSGAYVINRRAAQWFVDGLMPMQLPFDLAFDLEFTAGLRAAFVFPVPISQDSDLPSQIQGRRRAFHLSRVHYLTVLPYRIWTETRRFAMRGIRLLTERALSGFRLRAANKTRAQTSLSRVHVAEAPE